MKSRKVSVLLEIDTDEKLVRLGRKEFWTEAVKDMIGTLLTGEFFDIVGAKAMVSQSSKNAKKGKRG